MIFVSKKNKNEKLRLVGYYSDFDYIPEEPLIKNLSQTGIPIEKIKEMEEGLKSFYKEKDHSSEDVEEFVKAGINRAEYKIIVKKQDALIFPGYDRNNVELEDLAKIRKSFIGYIESSDMAKLIEKLEIWKDFIKKDTNLYITPYEVSLKSRPIIGIKSSVMQRVGQQIFRRKVLRKDNNECKICGINNEKFLEATHILSWKTDEIIAGDPYNGITLCFNHHKAFDLQKISFEANESPDKNGIVNNWILTITPDLLKDINLLDNLQLKGKNGSIINFKAKKEYFDKREDLLK